MKPFYYFIFIANFSTAAAFGQTVVKSNCTYYAISDRDSVCLDAQVNIDPKDVDRIISNSQKDILLIFDAWVNWGSRLLSNTNLKNEQIVEYLKRYKIITLYTDDKLMKSGKDSFTVGKKNMMYQVDKFSCAVQPYYLIIKGGKAKCSSGYMPSHQKILAFFKRCE
jgi:hypothetical protein